MRGYSRPTRDVLLEDFDTNGSAFLKRLRDQFPLEYVRTITRIMPMKPDPQALDPFENWTPEVRAEACQKAREVLEVEPDHLEALRDLRCILVGNFGAVGYR